LTVDRASCGCSVFCEADIDELLARGSRVVQITDGAGGEDGERTGIANFSFSKTQFQVTAGDTDVDMTAPDFWAKVLLLLVLLLVLLCFCCLD
jgi:hypothetical protein